MPNGNLDLEAELSNKHVSQSSIDTQIQPVI